MNAGKKAVFCGCAALVGLASICVVLMKPRTSHEPAPPVQAAATVAPRDLAPAVAPKTDESPSPSVQPEPPLSEPQPSMSVATVSGKNVEVKKTVPVAAPQKKGGKPELLDPVARVALAFVGADPVAEAYWYLAINDPELPPGERQDLIEDLNEDGLSDPKHPTLDDLPLIASRLAIIDSIGSEAMDRANADAFQEAYKDLVNLAAVALGGGEPVK